MESGEPSRGARSVEPPRAFLTYESWIATHYSRPGPVSSEKQETAPATGGRGEYTPGQRLKEGWTIRTGHRVQQRWKRPRVEAIHVFGIHKYAAHYHEEHPHQGKGNVIHATVHVYGAMAPRTGRTHDHISPALGKGEFAQFLAHVLTYHPGKHLLVLHDRGKQQKGTPVDAVAREAKGRLVLKAQPASSPELSTASER
jgi:hypothetical protein